MTALSGEACSPAVDPDLDLRSAITAPSRLKDR